MKFFILALVAVSVGLAECSDSVNNPQRTYTTKEVLAEFFNIKNKDLNEQCDKVESVEKDRWNKIGKAVSDLQNAVLAQRKEDPKKWDKLNDGDLYKAQINVIKTALPCANEAKVVEKLAHYKKRQNNSKKIYTPKEVLAKFFNIKDKDLNGKCDKVDTDEQDKWNKIEKAVSDLHDAVLAQRKQDPKNLEKLSDAEKYKAQINVIKTALPCANEANVVQILQFYKQMKQQKRFPKRFQTVKQLLAVFFNIKDKDLNEKCEKVDTDKKAWREKIGKALSDFQDAVRAAEEEEDPKKYEKLNDADKYKAQINVIKTALPCANEAKVIQFLEFYKHLKKQN